MPNEITGLVMLILKEENSHLLLTRQEPKNEFPSSSICPCPQYLSNQLAHYAIRSNSNFVLFSINLTSM